MKRKILRHLLTTLIRQRWTLMEPQETYTYSGTNKVTIQLGRSSQPKIYLFVKIPNFSFVIIVIFSRLYSDFNHALWKNLYSFCLVYNGHQLAFGDFNNLSFDKEKFGDNYVNHRHMNAFNNVIQNYNLLDLEFTGPKFTWSNCQKSNFIIERLDRFLANPS